jgi:hypothetical protein
MRLLLLVCLIGVSAIVSLNICRVTGWDPWLTGVILFWLIGGFAIGALEIVRERWWQISCFIGLFAILCVYVFYAYAYFLKH